MRVRCPPGRWGRQTWPRRSLEHRKWKGKRRHSVYTVQLIQSNRMRILFSIIQFKPLNWITRGSFHLIFAASDRNGSRCSGQRARVDRLLGARSLERGYQRLPAGHPGQLRPADVRQKVRHSLCWLRYFSTPLHCWNVDFEDKTKKENEVNEFRARYTLR